MILPRAGVPYLSEVLTMPTQRITIELPESAYAVLRDQVDSGAYASESECVAQLLREVDEASPTPVEKDHSEFERWMREEVLPADDELSAEPSSGYTPDDLRSILAEERGKLAKASQWLTRSSSRSSPFVSSKASNATSS